MGKLRFVIATLILAVSPLVWASTIAPPAQPTQTHDDDGKDTILTTFLSVPVAEATLAN